MDLQAAETVLLENKVVDEVTTTGMKLKTALRKFGLQHYLYTSKGSHRNGYNRIRRKIKKIMDAKRAKKHVKKCKCNVLGFRVR